MVQERMKSLRLEAKLTQKEIAEKYRKIEQKSEHNGIRFFVAAIKCKRYRQHQKRRAVIAPLEIQNRFCVYNLIYMREII